MVFQVQFFNSNSSLTDNSADADADCIRQPGINLRMSRLILQRGHLHMVSSVTNRLWFVWKILMVDLRGTEGEEREEISGVHIVH